MTAQSSKMQDQQSGPGLVDWLLLLALILIGGTSFAMIREAVATIPPVAIAVGRLWVGAIMMVVIMAMAGRRLPPLIDITPAGRKFSPAWQSMIACGVVGNAIPFLLFPWAQQYVASGLAGVYMAIMPIWTIGLAALFANEALTGRRLAGFGLGFIGVVILMVPTLMNQDTSNLQNKISTTTILLAQLAMVAATLGYAGSAVLARRAPDIRPRAFSAGILLSAAIVATPALLFTDLRAEQWSLLSIACVIGLGVFCTGLGAIMIIVIIQRNGAGFMSYANYITPVWAVILGALLFSESLHPLVFIALAIISAGLFVSQSRKKTFRNQPSNVPEATGTP